MLHLCSCSAVYLKEVTFKTKSLLKRVRQQTEECLVSLEVEQMPPVMRFNYAVSLCQPRIDTFVSLLMAVFR